jgi:hypothetical protein
MSLRTATPHRLAVLVLPCLLLAVPSKAPAAEPLLRLQAFAVNMSGVGRANAQTLQIVIERWTTDEERAMLLSSLVEKGTERLMDKLQGIRPRAGYIRTNTSLGWDIQYAMKTDLPSGGQRIVFATDRPMSFREAANSPRSKDYDFMVCEIRLGANGKGQGKLGVATKVTYDKEKKQIELENYGQEPVRLTEVSIEK